MASEASYREGSSQTPALKAFEKSHGKPGIPHEMFSKPSTHVERYLVVELGNVISTGISRRDITELHYAAYVALNDEEVAALEVFRKAHAVISMPTRSAFVAWINLFDWICTSFPKTAVRLRRPLGVTHGTGVHPLPRNVIAPGSCVTKTSFWKRGKIPIPCAG
jgi:hypothetical protein